MYKCVERIIHAIRMHSCPSTLHRLLGADTSHRRRNSLCHEILTNISKISIKIGEDPSVMLIVPIRILV